MPSVAAIDVGSSATRLSLVEVSPTGREVAHLYKRYPVRLGADVFACGAILPGDEAALLEAFVDIAGHMATHGVGTYRAVATSAMRDAKNGRELREAIERETGVHIEIISGKAESRISRNALVRSLGVAGSDTLLIDLGGGSLELEYALSRTGRSLPLGTVRLADRYPELRGPLSLSRLRSIQRELLAQMRRCMPRRRRVDVAVATGGNLDALARVLPAGSGYWPAVDLPNLQRFVEGVARLTVDERRDLLGVRADRADLFLPTALVMATLRRLFRPRALVVPRTGLRDGILHELVQCPSVGAQARRILRRFGGDVALATRRATLARHLFEALRPAHRLWAPAQRVLEVAALLADVGKKLDPEDWRQHSAYMVRCASGLALDEREREVAGYVLALTAPDPLPDFTARLLADDLPNARILGALLTIADAAVAQTGTSEPRVDLLSTPIVVDLGLPRPLEARRTAVLERALGLRLRIV